MRRLGLDQYSVLLVDDQWAKDGIFDKLRARLDPCAHVHIEVASNKEEALDLIKSTFFHVAFVDISLTHAGSLEGLDLLRHLKATRPSASRFLLTQFPALYRDLMFSVLVPGDPIIHGA